MARVTLTANLKKYYPETRFTVAGGTLRAVLDAMEARRPHFMSYVLEDNGHIRKHVNMFIDGQLVRDKTNIDIPVAENADIHIMQALSGG